MQDVHEVRLGTIWVEQLLDDMDRMKMKVVLTFACMNLKKLAKCWQEWNLQPE